MLVEAPSPSRRYAADLWKELGGEFRSETDRGTIGLAGEIVLELTVQGENSLLLVSPLALPKKQIPDQTLRRLLEANFLWRGSRGAVFGFDAGTPLLLQTADVTQASYEEFRLVVEDFLNTAAAWSSVCEASAEPSEVSGLTIEPNHVSPWSPLYTEQPDSRVL